MILDLILSEREGAVIGSEKEIDLDVPGFGLFVSGGFSEIVNRVSG